jgi:hypothetical protein
MNKTRKGLKPQKSGPALMDMYYLEARSHLIETAAILDRIERAAEGAEALETEKIQRLYQACEMLPRRGEARTEKLLLHLSV